MKITIHYKSDQSWVPYCAYTTIDGVYISWRSEESFAAAKQGLLAALRSVTHVVPEPETVEL